MTLERRHFLAGLGLLAMGGFTSACGGMRVRSGSSDPAALLREEVAGRKAVAALADLERRILFEPTDADGVYRADHGAYGTIKPITYWAGLRQGVIDPDTPYECTGAHCGFGGHGRINAFEAVWRGCNGFFIDLSYRLDRDRWLELLRIAGFGRATGLVEGEGTGACPERIDDEEAARALAAHGTGIRATALQQLVIAARFARGGESFPLGGKIVDAWPAGEAARVQLVRRAWRMHALKGAGQSADRKDFPVGSRTGASRGSGWYLGFGPFEAPRYVLVVHVGAPPEDPGSPSKDAQKIAASIWRGLGA